MHNGLEGTDKFFRHIHLRTQDSGSQDAVMRCGASKHSLFSCFALRLTTVDYKMRKALPLLFPNGSCMSDLCVVSFGRERDRLWKLPALSLWIF